MSLTMKQKRVEAGELVSIFAFAHSAVALTLANTLIGDTAILTGLTIWMIERIGAIYNCNNINPWKIMARVFGFCAGIYLGGKLLFFLPGLGNVANATATFIVTQTIGWTCIFLMESFDDPNAVTDEELKGVMKKAREIAKSNAEKNEEILKKMRPEEKKRFRYLNNRVQSGNLTEEEKQEAFTEIARMKEEILKR